MMGKGRSTHHLPPVPPHCYSLSSMLPLLLLLLFMATTTGMTKGCREVERDALLTFKAGILRDPAHRLSSWHRQSEDCCRWSGVVCDNTTGHIVQLNLQNPNSSDWEGHTAMKGEMVSPSLLSLTHLDRLNLSRNNFGGIRIPEFMGSFKKLRYLDLSGSNFGEFIPPQLANLSTSLLHLDLSDNFDLGGTQIPEFMGSFKKLRYLDLSESNFNGSISPQLANLSTTLLHLDLSHNNFTGIQIPKFMSSFNKLRYLDLSWSNFIGAIPPRLANLSSTLFHLDLSYNFYLTANNLEWLSHFSSLRFLDMSYVDLSRASHNWLPQVSMLHSLHELCLRESSLDSIPYNSSFFNVNLTSLTTLDLSSNNFHSTLPNWLWDINSLSHLDLSFNSLTGPLHAEIRMLSNLLYLDLSYNSLKGGLHIIPSSFSYANLTFLTTLDLSNNNFHSTLPNWLWGINNLSHLDLSFNSLTGPIPAEIRMLSNLLYLDLSYNSLEGDVHFANLTTLEALYLSGNSLTVTIGEDWKTIPSQLKYLGLGSCKLGPQFPGWLRWHRSILELDLSNTSIESTLPIWFWNSWPNINVLDVSLNHISGALPVSLENMTTLQILIMDSNMLRGQVPAALPDSLVILGLSNNQISGGIPQRTWESSYLEFLNLANNKLSGSIPSSTINFQLMRYLLLNNNSLSGELPLSLQNWTLLTILDLGENKLSGNIPAWIGERLQNLAVLRLHSNMFSGNIPPQLGQLKELQIVDLANNQLSGSIPYSFGNFSSIIDKSKTMGSIDEVVFSNSGISFFFAIDNIIVDTKGQTLGYLTTSGLGLVKSIDLSNNHLTGEIPKELGALVALQTLNLSKNNLRGKIPDTIGEMQSLQCLDLSFNKLSGVIPQTLSMLNFLSSWNVSYNNLSGMIPSGNQLQTLNDPYIYVGNAYLCGPPVSKSCSPVIVVVVDEEPKNEPEMKWFYLSIVMGFVVGLWGVFVVLLYHRAWRFYYFRMIDDTYDKFYVAVAIYLVKRRNRG